MARTLTDALEAGLRASASRPSRPNEKAILAELDAERAVSKALADTLAEVLEDTVTSAATMARWMAVLGRYREGL